VLGVTFSSSHEEIRRAYRVLARRYHPDLNPDKPQAEETFKKISAAYNVLSDESARKLYDAELEGSSFYNQEFQRATKQAHRAKKSRPEAATAYQNQSAHSKGIRSQGVNAKRGQSLIDKIKVNLQGFSKKLVSTKQPKNIPNEFIVLEISIDIKDALFGVKKTIEIPHGKATKKISLQVPAGLRDGSTIPLNQTQTDSSAGLVIIRLAQHPFLSLQRKGLVYEVPITISESFHGGQFVIPGVDEAINVKIPAGTSSGDELRFVGKGGFLKDGSRGDLFIRFMITSPETVDAVGIKDLARAFEGYYAKNPREKFPKSLF
jgi:curved DNA-binding protein